MSRKQIIWLSIGGGVLGLLVVGMLVWNIVLMTTRPAAPVAPQQGVQQQTQASSAAAPSNGAKVGISEDDLQRTGATLYDDGYSAGLNKTGIRMLSLEEAIKLGREGVRKYSATYGKTSAQANPDVQPSATPPADKSP